MDLRRWVLLVLGTMGLAKGLWAVLAPGSIKGFAQWWTKVLRNVNTLLGLAAMVCGAALWVLVLAHQDPVDWALLLFGVLFVWAGSLYFRPERLNKLVAGVMLDRDAAFIRVLGLLTVVISALLIWMALT